MVERLGDDVFRQQLGQIYQPVCLKWADNVYNLKFLSNEVVIRLTVSLGSRLPKRVFSPSCINQTDPLESNFDRVSSRYNVSQDDEDSLQHQNHSYFEKECLKQGYFIALGSSWVSSPLHGSFQCSMPAFMFSKIFLGEEYIVFT